MRTAAARQVEAPVLVEGEFVFTADDFARIAELLYQQAGISLSGSKSTLVYSRLAKRLRALGLDSFADYIAIVAAPEGADERATMLNALTTNVTRFFREPHHFDHLRDHVLAPRVAALKAGGRMRLWSAGCSTGQEPYSMAVTILSLLPDAPNLDIKILATDIDTRVLQTGREALYSDEMISPIPAEARSRWLERAGAGQWRMSAAARSLVTFKELNLIGQWPVKGPFDAIFCRNVVIYFDEPTQERIWGRFAPLLGADGRLFIGHSERVTGPAKFVNDGLTVYRPGGGARMIPARVVVVDDSPTMRGLISATLRRDPELQVVGCAGDPLEARQMIKDLNPDVITLDIEMPNMNGLEFLERIMRLRPMPVVMVSTLTQSGADATLRALELGAVDCVAKPTSAVAGEALSELANKVKTAARASVRPAGCVPAPRVRENFTPADGIVAIGSSTGGVEALLTVLSNFPANCPPTVITQHMPAAFTKSFAARLDRISGAQVEEASDGAPLQPGRVYLAPGGETHLEVVRAGGLRCRLRATDLVSGHRPSVDVLFSSVAHAAGSAAVGVILTGMGRDGAQGLKAMRDAGARTLGQDEATCVVYGMPRAAFEIGAVERQASLADVGPAILSLCEKRR